MVFDTSDKIDSESWSEYWDRKRRERHGNGCACYLCKLDRKEVRQLQWKEVTLPWEPEDDPEPSDRSL